MLTNLKLLESVAKQKKVTFISTGMSQMRDIERAVKIFKKYIIYTYLFSFSF